MFHKEFTNSPCSLYDFNEQLWKITHGITTSEHTQVYFNDTPVHSVELSDDLSKLIIR